MKILTILLITTLGLRAELPSDLDQLKTQYDAAIKRAVDPINNTYQHQLNTLFDKYKAAKNNMMMTAILKELKDRGFSVDDNEVVVNVDNKKLEHIFVYKSYKEPFGTVFHFEKNGEGWKLSRKIKTGISWRIMEDGILEISGRENPTSPTKYWYADFNDKKIIHFGQNKNDMQNFLVLER